MEALLYRRKHISRRTMKGGSRSGKWNYYFENGKIEQTGQYLEDLPHGVWVWYYENGQIRRQEEFLKEN